MPAAVSGAGDPVVNKQSQPSCSYCSREKHTHTRRGRSCSPSIFTVYWSELLSDYCSEELPWAHSYSRWMSTIQLSMSNDALCHPGKHLQHPAPVLTLQWIMGKLQKASTTSSIPMQEQFHFTDLSLPTIHLTLLKALGLQTEKNRFIY